LDHTIDFNSIGTTNINIRANTDPATVGSVVFNLDSDPTYQIESGAPYALASDNAGDYFAWTPSLGAHMVIATPYSEADGGGTAGTPLMLNFNVVDSASGLITNVGEERRYCRS
jgi:hypothetical protein